MGSAYICAILLLVTSCLAENIPCQGPHGLSGVCVPLEHCSNLYALTVLTQQLTPKVEQYLQEVECTQPDLTKGVCCQPDRVFEFSQNCGVQSTDRIARGEKTYVFEYPWVALMMYRYLDNNGVTGNCGGSLINDRYVLTAAHCVVLENPRIKLDHVRLGEHTISTEIDCNIVTDTDGKVYNDCADPVEKFNIETSIVHPNYNDTPHSNDIALIRLAARVQFKDHIQPICLPLGVNLQSMWFMNYTVAGWGYTELAIRADTLLKAVLPRMENAECQRKIDEINVRGPPVTISERQICAGGVGRIDSCRGDSGGPLMKEARYRGNTRIVLFGVVSFGIKHCGLFSFPGVYAHVGSYLSWIIANMYA